jgi:ketosteroid isomerase-like protein
MTLDDKFEITQLVARSAHCADYGDWAGMEALYTSDIVTEMEGEKMKFEGIASQIEHAQESYKYANGKNRLYQFNVTIDESPDGAYVNYYVVNVNAGSEPMGAQIVVTGRHRDKVVKTEDGWKFVHRFLTFDQSVTLTF